MTPAHQAQLRMGVESELDKQVQKYLGYDIAAHLADQSHLDYWQSPSIIPPSDRRLNTRTITTNTINQEHDDMSKAPRVLCEFAIVNKQTDKIDIQVLVAETQEEARDEIVRSRLPEAAKAKDFDIVILRSFPLSHRVTTDG